MNECTKQALDFLKKAKATCTIEFGGCIMNRDWEEKKHRNFYNVTISSPRGSMSFVFWDSIHNTEISKMTHSEYAKKRFKCQYDYLASTDKAKARKELKEKKAAAKPTEYDILVCLNKHDPGNFEEFCWEFGYDEDSKTAERIYIAVIKEYKQLERIFIPEQMEELREIN